MRLTTRKLEQLAQDPDLTNKHRLAFYAAARCNRDGHAQMQPRELRKLLGTGDAEASAATVSKALGAAKAAGLIGQESTPKCLVVDHREVDQGKGGRGCFVHGVDVIVAGVAA